MRLIDADELRKQIDYRQWDVDDDLPRDEASTRISECYVIDRMVDDMPTVDAVPVRHGMWLPKHHYIAGHEFVSGHICSECGDDALNAEGDEFLTDYCPNCGAGMDEE